MLDVITFYPPRGQAAIYLTLEYINLGLGKVMPYDVFFPYEDDYYRMVDLIWTDGSDEKLATIVSLMMDDLRIVTAPFEKSITKTGKIRKNSKCSPEALMSYGVMMDAVSRILKIFRTMTEDDINRLLNDRTQEGSVLYFNEIEKISDGIIEELMRGMMKSFNLD